MNHGSRLVVFPAKDLARSKAVFTALLGTDPYVDQPYYVGFRLGDQEVGLDPHGASSGPITYWEVDDINAAVQSLERAGAQVQQQPRDVGGGKLIAVLTDPDGQPLGLVQSPGSGGA